MADDFSQFLLGESDQSSNPKNSKQSKVDFDVNKTYGTPSKLLDNLRITESSGNPYALNKDTKAMGNYQFIPETIIDLHKKGIKFNPLDEKESRAAADWYIGQLAQQNGGDYKKAMAQFGGFKTKNPTDYVNKVLNGVDVSNPNEKPNQQSTDEFSDFLGGSSAPLTQPTQVKTNKPSREELIKAIAPQPQKTTVGASTAALGDVLPNIAGAIADFSAYTAARYGLHKSPEESRQIANYYSEDYKNPIGKATNLVGTTEYENAPVNKLMDFIGQNIDKGAHWIAKQTGKNVSDIQNIINGGSFIVPEVGGKLIKTLKGAEVKGAEKTTISPGGKGETGEGITTVSPITETAPIGPKYDVPTYLRNKFQEKQGNPPIVETIKTNEEGSAKPYDSSKDFNELHYSESSLPKDEQQARLETLHRIDPNLKVDPNVIEGRGKERATDYELSKTDTPEGNVLSEKENEYKTSLNNYGEKIITDTGGTVGLDETSNYRRGEKTLDYFQKLENHFNDKLTKIYKERDAIAKDIPVNGENISNALKDESLTTLNSESEGLAKAAKAKLKSLHMMDNEGNMLPSNGMQAEKFRQWLNENNVWSNKNASLHRALKDSVDADVISTLDPNTSIYKEARELFVLKKNTLENPNGISKILDAEGPNKINRKIDIENIPNSITKMGVNQFTHILDTIKNAPPELQSAANESMAQIKSHFLNQAHAEFQRSASAGTKYLKANREVMTRLFNPEEMSKINDYNSAAHILKVDTRYKGAYVQKTNLEPRLTTKIGNQILKKGAAIGAEALTGGLTHGIAAATAHEVVGGKIAKSEAKSLEKILQENARKKQTGFTNLQDIMNTGKKE